MRNRHADGKWVVRTVNQVCAGSNRQPHGIGAQRVIRARADYRRQRFAMLGVLFAHGVWRIPRRILLLADDLGIAKGGVPIHLANAHRVGDDNGLLVLFPLREIVQPVFRQVDDDAFLRRIWKDASAGNQKILSCSGQPRIDAWIGACDLFPTEAEAAGDICKRVFVGGRVVFDRSEHYWLSFPELIRCCPRWHGNERSQQRGKASE